MVLDSIFPVNIRNDTDTFAFIEDVEVRQWLTRLSIRHHAMYLSGQFRNSHTQYQNKE